MFSLRPIITLAIALAAAQSLAQQLSDPPITVPNSSIHSLHSAINGSDYQLFIILPRSYQTSAKRYPVMYLLDGNDTATIAWLTRSRQHSDVPEIIFVGIGYPEPLVGPPVPLPGRPAVPAAQRSADYATFNTTEPWSPPRDKGAPVFLKVIQKEIIPYVDANFRTDPSDRGIGGHSLGGLFTTWALFHATDTFIRFWIGSPSLLWDNSARFRDEKEYAATHKDLRARVFADVGGLESKTFTRDPLFAMQHAVESRHYPHLSWKTVVLPTEDHGTLPLAGMAQTLDVLYGPPYIPLDQQTWQQLAGDWKLTGAHMITFTREGDTIFATGLPFLSNTDPTKEQFITPFGAGHYQLRTMLDMHLESKDGRQQLVIKQIHGDGTVVATRP